MLKMARLRLGVAALVALSTSAACSGGTDESTQPIDGTLPKCRGDSMVNRGAMDGEFTLSGRVTDADGNPIVGQQIRLRGTERAVRFTDITGSYSFQVDQGSYTLTTDGSGDHHRQWGQWNAYTAGQPGSGHWSAHRRHRHDVRHHPAGGGTRAPHTRGHRRNGRDDDCTLTPRHVHLRNLNQDTVQDFVATGSGCATATAVVTSQSPTGQVLLVPDGAGGTVRTTLSVVNEESSTGAMGRLDVIADEQPGTENVTIHGYPAIQRVAQVQGTKIRLPEGHDHPMITVVTVATAVDDKVVRFETKLPETASEDTIETVLAMGRNFDPGSVELITGDPLPTYPQATAAAVSPPAQTVELTPSGTTLDAGEIDVAAADVNGAVVVASIDATYYSSDSLSTLAASTLNTTPAPNGAGWWALGDPSVSVGAPDATGNQTFYMTRPTRTSGGAVVPTVAIGLFTSTDYGATFNPATTPYPLDCTTDPNCVVPDQPLVVVDRYNRATVAGVGHDQVYLAWRDGNILAGGAVTVDIGLACSPDSGATWNMQRGAITGTGADKARIRVAPNGDLLVAYGVFRSNDQSVMLQRFTSCANGFAPVTGFPVEVGRANNLTAMAGMPRQPDTNYSTAALESDATGNTVFVAYATETSPGNDDVVVARSTDGGLNWPTTTVMNQSSAGHRYYPSICSTGQTAHVTWYDRRAGTAAGASPDLTAYYRSSLLNGGTTLGTEFNVTTTGYEDPQCLTGFPADGRSTTSDAETLCTNLPSNVVFGTGECYGTCAAGATPPCGSGAACDYRAAPGTAGACAVAGETCQVPPGAISAGWPKYGDYVFTDCAQGRVFMAWAAGSPPAGACRGSGLTCSAGTECCSGFCSSTGVCAGQPGCVSDGMVRGAGTCCNGSSVTWNGTDFVCAATTCAANGGACAGNDDCCSGSCQGGQCFAGTQIYAQSTSCIGDVPSDLTCGTSTPPTPVPMHVTLRGEDRSELASWPFRLCGEGQGFTPNGEVTITVYHPTQPGQTRYAATADADGNFVMADLLFDGVTLCTESVARTDAVVIFADEASGQTIEPFGTIPLCWFCDYYTPDDGGSSVETFCSNTLNGGCS